MLLTHFLGHYADFGHFHLLILSNSSSLRIFFEFLELSDNP